MESLFLQQMAFRGSKSTSPTDDISAIGSLLSQNQRSDDHFISSLSGPEIDALNACSLTTDDDANNESISAIDSLLLQNQGSGDNFIASLSESEIDALNACYTTTNTTITNDASSTTNKPDDAVITESQQDPYSKLFFPTQDPEASSDESSSMMNLLPTPMGGSCNIVQTTDQVPLNQSLISQSNSLAAMFQPSPAKCELPNTVDKGSFFASIGTSHIIAGAGKNNLVEADFGSSLIAAPSAQAGALPLSNLALPMSLESAATSLPTDNNKTTSATMEDTLSSPFESGRNQRHRPQQSTRRNERYQELQLPKTADKGSLFSNIGTSHIIGVSKNNLVEADFGSSLIAAPSEPVALPLSNLPLPLSLQSAAPLSPTDNEASPATMEDTLSSCFESSRNQRHRSQQSTRWNERYQELTRYRREHGDCNVPYLWSNNRPLSEWVKRQRHQYKLKQEGKNSALTDKRENLLTKLGFVWNSRDSLWDRRFRELIKYFQKYGNLKVSKHTAQHRALSVWLKRQRHACRLYASGDRSTCMTEARMQKLLDLGVKIVKMH